MTTAGVEQAWDDLDAWLDDLPPSVRLTADRHAASNARGHITELGPCEWGALIGAGPGSPACEVSVSWSPQRMWLFSCSCGRASSPCVHAAIAALLLSEQQRSDARHRLLGHTLPAPAPPPESATVVSRLKLEVLEDGPDWFELRTIREVSDTTLTALELKALIDAEGAWVDLGRKGFRRLLDETDAATLVKLTEAGLRPRGTGGESRRVHAVQLAGDSLRTLLPIGTRERLEARAATLAAQTPAELPAALRAQLRPYQIEGFKFLTTLAQAGCGALLADDMGLGKTVQTLAWLAWLREQTTAGTPEKALTQPSAALVVCPKSLTDNWRAEAHKFLPGLHVRVWKARDLRAFHREAGWAGLNILSYPQLRLVAEKLDRVRFLAAVLDEAQAIKNPDSSTSRAARAIQGMHRLALTGTPVENRLLDLWSIFAFAVPGLLGSRPRFEREVESLEGLDGARDLASRVRPFVLRRTKGQVAHDLPPRIEEDLYCEMGEAQQRLYTAELKKAQQQLVLVAEDRQFQQERFHVLASLMRLRQICCDPELLFPGAAVPSAKLEALDDLVDPILAEGHKLLIFSQFTSMLATLKIRLQPLGAPIFSLTGATENRGQVVDRFNQHDGPAVFLISLKAGGSGLNLASASYVILFDPWWNPAAEAQAIDRAHRIGQSRTVIAYRLLIKNSLEEKIRSLQASKAALAHGVLGEESLAQSLDLAALRALLQG
ncbi:MAG: DEAD/DEAH box helicase [Verrucomicrobiales bacterium]